MFTIKDSREFSSIPRSKRGARRGSLNAGGGGEKWRIRVVFAFLVLALAVPMLRSGTIDAAAPQVSGNLDQYGFPTWYEDNNGVRLEACLDITDSHCVLVSTPSVYDTQQPLAFPTNFPDEFFYFAAESDRVTTPGCAGAADPLAAEPGQAFVVLALEAAFANGLPAHGEQMVFGRVRVVVRGGLCPNTPYTFTHPYGSTTLTTDESGGIKPTAGTVDVGCFPVAPQLCNWSQALASPVLSTGFVRWDPAIGPAADRGYLGGDPGVLHPIVGGVNNAFTVTDGANLTVATTNLSLRSPGSWRALWRQRRPASTSEARRWAPQATRLPSLSPISMRARLPFPPSRSRVRVRPSSRSPGAPVPLARCSHAMPAALLALLSRRLPLASARHSCWSPTTVPSDVRPWL